MGKLLIRGLAAAAVALSFVLPANSSFADDALPLTIAVAPAGVDTWPVFVGIEKGIFEKHGVDLKAFTSIQSGPEAIRVMQSGEADLAATGSGPAAAARAAGVPLTLIVLLSGGYKNDDLNAIVTLEDSGIEPGRIEDLQGKRVGVTLGTTPHEQLLAALTAKNVPLSSVELSNVKPSDLPIALQQKSVDAIILWEPVVTHVLKTVPGSVIVARGGGYVSGNAGIATLDNILAEKREALKRFVAAMSETNHWIRHNRDETAEIGTRVQPGLDVEVAKEALVHFGFDGRISKKNVKGIEEGVQFLLEQKRFDTAVDINSIVDASLINEVMTEKPEYFSDLPPIAEQDIIR